MWRAQIIKSANQTSVSRLNAVAHLCVIQMEPRTTNARGSHVSLQMNVQTDYTALETRAVASRTAHRARPRFKASVRVYYALHTTSASLFRMGLSRSASEAYAPAKMVVLVCLMLWIRNVKGYNALMIRNAWIKYAIKGFAIKMERRSLLGLIQKMTVIKIKKIWNS